MQSSIAKFKVGLSTINGDLLHGLPLEIWRVVFSYLKARDLCCCSQVCKDWNELVNSLDATRWKFLYLQQKKSKRWKHPNWPNETNSKLDASWKVLYRQRHKLSKLWLRTKIESSCSPRFFFGHQKQRKILHVGANKSYHSLRAALEKASPFAKIIIHPGVYQDASTVYLKFPVEVLGADDSSKIVLMMQIEIRTDSAKLENLTIKPIYPRVRRRGTSTALLRVLSGHLYMFNCTINQGGVLVVSPGMVTISGCSFTASFINLQGISYSSISCCDFTPNRFAIYVEEPLFHFVVRPSIVPAKVGGWIAALNEKKFEDFYKDCMKGGSGKRKLEFSSIGSDCVIDNDNECKKLESQVQDENEKHASSLCDTTNHGPVIDADVKQLLKLSQGVIIRNIKVSNGKGGITICRMGQAWIENSTFHDLSYGIRVLQNSKCVILNNKLHSCETTGIFMRDHSCGLIAGNQIFANGEAGIDIRSNADPIIQHNEIHSGRRCGIVCLENGKGNIRENDIYNNQEAGIYILHHGSPKIRNNFIWSGRAAGIAVTEDGRGHITKNVISGMEWAGIDIRHGGNPVISHNVIKNGQSDGIVIGKKGKSVILDNTISGNCGCGIWILDGSHPLVHSNRISYSGSNGIAFVSKSDQEHDNQRLHSQYSPSSRRVNNNPDVIADEASIMDEDFQVAPLQIPEIEPESRFIHVSRPEKTLAQLESNFVENNKGNGILYDGQEGIVISKNKITGNSKHGINLLRSNEITILNNIIRNNLLSGLHIDVGVCCSVLDNGIFDNKEYGVFSGGVGLIKGNDILSHLLPSVFLRSMANISVMKNRLHSWKHESIYIEEKSRVSLEENEFFLSACNAKEVCIHPGSDTNYVQDSNVIHFIDVTLNKYGERLTVEDLCLGVELLDYDKLKPNLQEVAGNTAPFFTSLDLDRKTNVQKSSFCTLL